MSGSDSIFVEPGELRAAVTEVAAAQAALSGARGALDSAGSNVDAGIDHADRADDKVHTFVRQWRSEFELISEMLGAFSDVLTKAAQCYEDADAELAQCLVDAGG